MLFVAVFQKELVSGFRKMNVDSLISFWADAAIVRATTPTSDATFRAIVMLPPWFMHQCELNHFSSNAAAAATSAADLDPAVAVASPMPTTRTVTVTTGAWSGPVTESTVYSG